MQDFTLFVLNVIMYDLKFEVFMARKKNLKGYCDERCLFVFELNLCDYFKGKRKNSKVCCKNCVHFQRDEITIPKKPDKDGISEKDL